MLVTDALKSDHRCIGRMLTIVQKAGNCLDFGQQVSPKVFHDACDFFDHFVDAYHCNQEENALFPALATLKLPPDGCSLRAFRADHAQARLIAGTISSLSTRFAAGDTRVKHPLVLAVRSYVNLLWSHILREDHLLFVAADDLLPATEQQALSACARIEGTLMNAAAHTLRRTAHHNGKRCGRLGVAGHRAITIGAGRPALAAGGAIRPRSQHGCSGRRSAGFSVTSLRHSRTQLCSCDTPSPQGGSTLGHRKDSPFAGPESPHRALRLALF